MNLYQKALAAPIVALVSLLLLAGVALYAMTTQQTAIDDLYNARLQNLREAGSTRAQVLDAHAKVYRLMTWASTLDASRLETDAQIVDQQIAATAATLGKWLSQPELTPEEKDIGGQIAAQVARYRNNVAQSLDLASSDINMGLSALQTADDDFKVLSEQVTQLVEVEEKLSRGSYEEAGRAFQRTRWLMIAVALLAMVLALATGTLIARAMVGSVRQAVAVADAIAGGRLDNTLPAAGKDEIGDLLRAFGRMQEALSGIVMEIKSVVQSGVQGDFTRTIQLDGKSGFGRDIGISLNDLNSGLLHQIGGNPADAVAAASRIAAGDLSVSISLRPGDDASILAAMATMRRELEGVIEEVRAMVNGAANGDFSRHMDLADKSGYPRTLSELLNRLSDTAREALVDIAGVAQALSEGDLTRQVVKDYPGLFGSTARGINSTSERLRELIGNVVEAVDTISQASREIAQGNRDLSERTEEQATSLEETAANMDRFSTVVQTNAGHARQANDLAVQSSALAVEGGEVVHASVQTMQGISTASRKIADIIGLIDGIAFQTNILALNAAVEAARAGEQGRGFAVVAAEVRALAQRSAGAAKEIKELIADSLDRVNGGTQRVNQAGTKMEEIVASIAQVSKIISDISATSTEQAGGIQEVDRAIGQMDAVTQQNAAQVEQVAAAAESLEEQARHLQKLVSYFCLESETRLALR